MEEVIRPVEEVIHIPKILLSSPVPIGHWDLGLGLGLDNTHIIKDGGSGRSHSSRLSKSYSVHDENMSM